MWHGRPGRAGHGRDARATKFARYAKISMVSSTESAEKKLFTVTSVTSVVSSLYRMRLRRAALPACGPWDECSGGRRLEHDSAHANLAGYGSQVQL